jgi:O-acetyl-ADP-ribose deacetylase (regulator of RNase III)/isopentenyldiphosphate isomerase
MPIELFRGDITTLGVDAIVNAANPGLTPGGTVGLAIHDAAGPELKEACAAAGGRAPGSAAITPGFRLPARYVIHAVGASWHGGMQEEVAALARTYRSCFALAAQHGIRTIAFPAISCGVYSFPFDVAATIAIREARLAMRHGSLDRVIFALFTEPIFAAYEAALAREPELIDVAGGPKSKDEVHRDGDWHVASHIWLVTSDGRVLLQRRSVLKENWPGRWDVSAAGHVSAGETPIDAAVRETREELGLDITAEELVHIGTVREQHVLHNGAYLDNEVHEVFVVRRDVDPSKLVLQASEVDEVALVAGDDFDSLQPLTPHHEEYWMLRQWLAGAVGQHRR